MLYNRRRDDGDESSKAITEMTNEELLATWNDLAARPRQYYDEAAGITASDAIQLILTLGRQRRLVWLWELW